MSSLKSMFSKPLAAAVRFIQWWTPLPIIKARFLQISIDEFIRVKGEKKLLTGNA